MSEEPGFFKILIRHLFFGEDQCCVCGKLFNPKKGIKTGFHDQLWKDHREFVVCSEECKEAFLNPSGRRNDDVENEAED